MATASNRFVNISTCTLTRLPSGSVTITTVQSVALTKRSKDIQATGDADFFPTLSVTVGSAPMVVIQHQNAGLLNTIDEKFRGSSFTWTNNDAVNGVSTGAITYTLSNVNVVSHETTANHQQLATCSLTIEGQSSDGQTSPLAITIAS